jgi:hypothetical protein
VRLPLGAAWTEKLRRLPDPVRGARLKPRLGPAAEAAIPAPVHGQLPSREFTRASNVEPEQQNVAVLDDVVPPFTPHEPLLAGRG